MNRLRIRNLRCLEDTGSIEIRPITILLGQNSSGKSTFLRTFPLLRQTVEARTRSPILWFGRLVDFGGFYEALYSGAVEKEITLGFSLSVPRWPFRSMESRVYGNEDDWSPWVRHESKIPPIQVAVEVFISHDPEPDIAFTRKVNITFEGNSISLATLGTGKVEKVTINGVDATPLFNERISSSVSTLVPLIEHRQSEANEPSIWKKRLPPALFSLASRAKIWMHGNTNFGTAVSEVRQLPLGAAHQVLERAKQLLGSRNVNVRSWTEDSPGFRDILSYTIAVYLPRLFQRVNRCICEDLSGIRYIEPLRATADRFYRFQELAVDEIDAQGRNLPMFIHALDSVRLGEFQEWTREHFGFFIKPERHEGHLSLLVHEAEQRIHNLADSGFGYSQILPIATQLWWQSQMRLDRPVREQASGERGGILAMEQPELHLHPRLQSNIADAFAAAVRTPRLDNNSFRVIAETHSEAIVNRLGQLIALGKLRAEDVNIVLFERDNPESPSKVTLAKYDEKGYLVDWPYGFFNTGR